MKKIDFYLISNQVVDARFKLASRLSNKLLRLEQRTLVITENQEQCENLSRIMWSFSDTSFVAHEQLNENSVNCNINISSITEVKIEPETDFDVLINTSNIMPKFNRSFSRIAEIVEFDESAKALARERYKIYQEQGFELDTHTIEL